LTLFYSITKPVARNTVLQVLIKTAADSRTKGAWGPHEALGTAVENHCCRSCSSSLCASSTCIFRLRG